MTGWYFLLSTLVLYALVAFFRPDAARAALGKMLAVATQVVPVLALVFILMFLTNYFVKPRALVRHLGKGSGVKGWLLAIIAGIISTGPIYLWYPLLQDLQRHGVRNALIATFLYNRSVKIPLLPLLISYFGALYALILLSTTIIVSVIQGALTELLAE